MPRLSLSFFGSFRATLDENNPIPFSTRAARALLVYLAMHPGQPFQREHLAGLFWPDASTDEAQTSLRQTLYRLRQALTKAGASEADYLFADTSTINFNAHSDYVLDVQQFTHLLDQCDSHAHSPLDGCSDCQKRMEAALALYHSGFLTGFSLPDAPLFTEWQTLTQERLHRRVIATLDTLVAWSQRRQAHSQTVAFLQNILGLEPWRDESHLALMRAWLLDGKRHLALQQYAVLTRTLADELHVPPSPAAQALHAQLLAGYTEQKPLQSPPVNPYCGLNAFDQSHAVYFFGREELIARLLTEVKQRPLSLLVGVSGSGKSSLLNAGLLPALTSPTEIAQGRRVVILRPGIDPFASLLDALHPLLPPDGSAPLADEMREGRLSLSHWLDRTLFSDSGESASLVILIDQFEELFSLHLADGIRQSFLDLLVETASSSALTGRLAFLIALRADFLGQVLAYGSFASAVQESLFGLGALSRDEMTRAVEMPAQMQGIHFEPGLVERLLDEVGDDAGRLPLLQFCLSQLWQEQEEGWIGHSAYAEMEGLSGALNHYANGVLARMEPAQQSLARRILLRLVHIQEDMEASRRIGLRSDFSDAEWAVVQVLTAARLLVTDRTTSGEESVELVHEALINGWQRLRDWLQEERTFQLWRSRTAVRVRHWLANGEDEGDLLRGPALAEAERWWMEFPEELSRSARRYVESSLRLRQEQQATQESQRHRELEQARQMAESERERADSEARAGKRLRLLAAALILAGLLASVIAFFAVIQQRRAEAGESQALAAAMAQSTEVAIRITAEAEAHSSEADARAAQAVAEAERQVAQQMARLAQARELASESIQIAEHQVATGLLLSLESLERSQEPQDTQRLFTALKLDPLLETTLHTGQIGGAYQLTVGAGSAWLANTDGDGRLYRWEKRPDGFRQSSVLPLSREGFSGLSLAPGAERYVIDMGEYGTLHDGETHQMIGELVSPEPAELLYLGFSGDGSRVIGQFGGNALLIWDAQTGRQIGAPIPIKANDNLCAIDNRGRQAGIVYFEGDSAPQIAIHSLPSFRPVGAPRPGHVDDVHHCRFSPDGRILATAGFDGTVRLWDTTTGDPLFAPLESQDGRILSLAFSPDGRFLASGASDNTVAIWDVTTAALWTPLLIGHKNWVLSLAFSDDGRLYSSDSDGEIFVWNLNQRQTLGGHTGRVRSVALHPSGSPFVTSSFDRSLVLWDGETGTKLATIPTEHPNSIIQIGFSPDGKNLASIDAGGNVILWSNPDGLPAGWLPRFLPLAAHKSVLIGLAFSADSKRMATGDFDGVIRLWDVAQGEPLPGELQTSEGGWALSLAFSPDGRILASGMLNGRIDLWSVPDLTPAGPSLLGHTNWVTSLLFDPDGKTLYSASNDQTIRRWAMPSGEPLGDPLEGHRAQVWGLALAQRQGEELLVSLGGDGGVIWWDKKSLVPIGPVLRTYGETESFAVNADGSRIYLGSFNERAQIWQADLAPWPERACRIANRNLTEAEWRYYLRDEPYQESCP